MLPDLIERRIGLAVTIASIAVFGLFLVVAPAFFPSFDEWKYFGIGNNIWAGKGITTVFGGEFLLHGPIWSAVVTLPDALFGGDSHTWGRVLNGLSGATIVGVAAWLGWRIRPAAGALAAVALVAILYLHDQSRTARLDVPATAFAVLYVAIGLEALRRGSTKWGIAAGAVFALAFLIKEIDIPFAPIPFFAAVLWGLPWRTLLRVTAWTMLVATIGMSWWFALYAAETGRFYRLESPAWTLLPVTAIIAALVVIGLGADRLARMASIDRRTARFREPRADRILRIVVSVGGALLWAGAQLLSYSRAARLKGGPILTPSQLDLYADQWINPYWFAVIPAAAGLLLSFGALYAYRGRREFQPMVDLFIAGICGSALVIFVVGVGEPPRNYLGQIAFAAPLMATGLLWALDWFVAERRAWLTVPLATVIGGAVGLLAARRLDIAPWWLLPAAGAAAGFLAGWLPIVGPRLAAAAWGQARNVATAGLLVASLVVATGALGVHVLAARPTASGPARNEAITTTQAWIRENVPPGSKLAFGSFLGYEMALGLVDSYEVFHARHGNVSSSVEMPDGIRRTGERPTADWVSVDTAPRNINEFQAFRAGWFERDIVKRDIDYWVYSVGTDTSAQTVLAAVGPDNGFDEVAHFEFEIGTTGRALETYIFRIDTAKVAFDPNVVYFSPEAFDRLLDLFERAPADAAEVAARLEPQVRIVPESPDDEALMARLRQLAGPAIGAP